MIWLRLAPWIALVLAGSLAWGLWNRIDTVTAERDAARAAYEQEKRNEKIVERVVVIEKEVIRRVPIVQSGLRQLCDKPAVPGAGVPAGPTDTEAGNVRAGRLDRLGGEVSDCLQESERLVGLIEACGGAK